MPALTVGLDIPILAIGPGHLGLNFSGDWIFTLILVESQSALGSLIGSVVVSLLGSTTVSAGVLYSVPL